MIPNAAESVLTPTPEFLEAAALCAVVRRFYRAGSRVWPNPERRFVRFSTHSSPTGRAAQTHCPDDPYHFGALVWVFLSFPGRNGTARFDLWACSPSWLAEAYRQTPPTPPIEWMNGEADFLRSLLLMAKWDENRLLREVDEICDLCAGPTWPIVALRLNRYMLWEYDDEYDQFQDDHPDRPLPA